MESYPVELVTKIKADIRKNLDESLRKIEQNVLALDAAQSAAKSERYLKRKRQQNIFSRNVSQSVKQQKIIDSHIIDHPAGPSDPTQPDKTSVEKGLAQFPIERVEQARAIIQKGCQSRLSNHLDPTNDLLLRRKLEGRIRRLC